MSNFLLPTRLRALLLAFLLVCGNILLLVAFPPSLWPRMWPQPAISWLIVLAVIVLWMQQQQLWSKQVRIRLTGGALVFLCEIYAWHSLSITLRQPSLVSILHLVAAFWINAVIVLGVWNQLRPRDQRQAPTLAELPEVAVVIPTYGEPIHVLELVIRAAAALDYPRGLLRVYVSDDGHRDEVAQLARRCGVLYLQGPRKDAKAGNLNSAIAAISRLQPACDFVLTQDADEVIDPQFLHKVVGYFANTRVAFVQTPKECVVPDSDPFGNRDRVFYDSIQVGRNGDNAAFACGSGVLWRISAVEQVGGFNTWNLVEDMTTSYELHNAGFDSVYHNEVLSVGLAPDDIPGMLKQRGTWAVDTWRMFLFDNPLLKRGNLTLQQRLHYLELGLFYFTSAFIFPLLFFIPMLALLTGDFLIVEGSILFPWIAASTLYYLTLAEGSGAYVWRYWQYWIGHTPTYLSAFWTAVRSRDQKPRYVVTRKTRLGGFHGHLLWPQFLLLLLACISIVVGITLYGATHSIFVLTNVLIVIYYTLLVNGICNAAFFGVGLADLPIVGQLVRVQRRVLAPRAATRIGARTHDLALLQYARDESDEPLIALERGAD